MIQEIGVKVFVDAQEYNDDIIYLGLALSNWACAETIFLLQRMVGENQNLKYKNYDSTFNHSS